MQESILNEEQTSQLIAAVRTLIKSNKGIITSKKFEDEDFNKRLGQVGIGKLIRNIDPKNEDKPMMVQEAINYPTYRKQ